MKLTTEHLVQMIKEEIDKIKPPASMRPYFIEKAKIAQEMKMSYKDEVATLIDGVMRLALDEDQAGLNVLLRSLTNIQNGDDLPYNMDGVIPIPNVGGEDGNE